MATATTDKKNTTIKDLESMIEMLSEVQTQSKKDQQKINESVSKMEKQFEEFRKDFKKDSKATSTTEEKKDGRKFYQWIARDWEELGKEIVSGGIGAGIAILLV